jgi:hypothetical protein
MKTKLLAALLMLLFVAACGAQTDTGTAGNLDIQLHIEPENPSVGESMLYIEVKDAAGQAVTDAEISVIGNMSHEGMAAIEASGSTNENGVYSIPFEWTMGGDWFLDVTVTLANNGGTVEKRFEIFVNAASDESIIHQTPEGN